MKTPDHPAASSLPPSDGGGQEVDLEVGETTSGRISVNLIVGRSSMPAILTRDAAMRVRNNINRALGVAPTQQPAEQLEAGSARGITPSMVRWLQNMVSLNEQLANKATDSRDERNFRNYASAYASALTHALKLEPVDLGDNQQPVKVTRICYCCSSCGLVASYEDQPCPLCAARLQLAEATRERDDARQVIGDLKLGPPGWRRAPEVDSALKEAAERSAEQYSQRGNLEKK